MPQRDTAAAPGVPCWMDLSTSDLAKSITFYEALFGWKAQQPSPDFGGYVTFDFDGRPVAGAMENSDDSVPEAWSLYFASEDNAAVIEKAVDGGATVFSPDMPVGDLGRMAFLVDPAGALFGLWQAGQHLGFGTVAEPGAPCWHENYTTDYPGATEFYSKVLGWNLTPIGDTDEFRYSTAIVDGGQVAGVMAITKYFPEGFPSHWQNYIGVTDTDAAVATVLELGGTVIEAAADSPFGRLATVADSNGATFKIIEANPDSYQG